MTLIKDHKKFIEGLKLKYLKVSREGVIIHLIDNNFKELAKKELKEIKNIESICDSVNANYGNETEFCLFCLSDEYNGKDGIKHGEGCVLTLLRNRTKDLEEVVNNR